MNAFLPDTPIRASEDDHFGRERLARSLTELLHNTPPDTSMRLGVYGEWGEGKTSFLRLMEQYLLKHNHICVWLAPWLGKNTEEIWATLLFSIAEQVKANTVAFRGAQVAAKKVGAVRGVAADSHWGFKILNEVVGDRVQEAVDHIAKGEKSQLLELISERRGERKIIVFVDDLDRTAPAIVPTLLMSLREIFDFPGFYYVLALSPRVIAQGLSDVGFGGERPELFLEKIVELPIYLPPLDERAILRYIEQGISSIADDIRVDTLRGIAALLPRNPRRIKLLLRYLASLKGELGRFSNDEINWRRLYLAQMLRLEFPEEARRLAEDKKTIQSIEFSLLSERMQKNAGVQRDEDARPEIGYAPSDEDGKARFMKVCLAIREEASFAGGRFGLSNMLSLVEDPPLITWKEIQALFAIFETAPVGEARNAVVSSAIGKDKRGFNRERAAAVFQATVDLRDAYLDKAGGSDLARDVEEAVTTSDCISALLRTQIGSLGLFEKGVLVEDSWTHLFRHLLKWSRIHRQVEYRKIRSDEVALMNESVKQMPIVTQLAILETPVFRVSERVGGERTEFLRAAEAVEAGFASSAVESLLERFEMPDGLNDFWSSGREVARRRYLSEVGSPFHSRSARARLRALARRAINEPKLQQNFYTYLRMLADSAFGDSGPFNRSEAQTLLANGTFIRMVWSAAVSRPLNAPMVGTLRDYRTVMLTSGTKPQDVPLPRWWKRLERSFFQPPQQP